jgi:hypothetical protein
MKFHRRTGTSDLAYFPQVSTDMINWRDEENTDGVPPTTETAVTPLGNGIEEVTVRTTLPIDDLPRHFMRLRVALNP